MPKTTILIDEFHLTVRVPRTLSRPVCDAIRQTLDDPHFQADLRSAVRAVIRRYLALAQVRVTLTR